MLISGPLFLILCLLALTDCADDFYQLLGVSRDADNRAIRRAFKKLALVKHPDKNPNDKNAHDEFVKLNRAYEVLMNDELRKKYDEHGEEGLESNFESGGQYQSWQFYRDNFGIYDEDAEIVTLSRSDFEQKVYDSGEIWFINFYSTYCSHCHHLAPTWRKFAREMDGVLRIGAVNCAEDPMLCQSQGVMGYPSLVIYPHRQFFTRARELDELIDFAMRNVIGEVHIIKNLDIDLFDTGSKKSAGNGWLLSFCAGEDSANCISPMNRRKLAAALHGLINVGSVNCDEANKICKLFDRSTGLIYFKHAKNGTINEIDTMDLKEIVDAVLNFVPSLDIISPAQLIGIMNDKYRKKGHLVSFVSFSTTDPEMKKLEMKLGNDVQVSTYICSKSDDSCDELEIKDLPKWVLFKNNGGHEIYYGKISFHDIVSFVKTSQTSPLITLTAKSYAEAIESNKEWLIDYFAPWCPPCLRLLSELRKLHNHIDGIKIGTVDCVFHADICRKVGANSYPTTALYNNGKVNMHVGYQSVQSIAEFIEDVRNPVVIEITENDFESLVMSRAQNTYWLIDFFAPWCGPCQQLTPEYKKLARNMQTQKNVHFGMFDCTANHNFCQRNGVSGYPTVRLYTPAYYPVDYPPNYWLDHQTMEAWLRNHLPSKVSNLGEDFYSRVLDDREPWLVDFFAPWCSHCVQFAPVFEQIAEVLDGRVKLAKIDCTSWRDVCGSAQVSAYPTLRLYLGMKKQSSNFRQQAYGQPIESQQFNTIVHLVENAILGSDKVIPLKTEL